ncbi:MAG: xanthine dehydrogenase family protein molybdopterin-binding subunit [Pseudomonadota bacterium]|nr:xanthine dehydrogenase family protein molybdopterin-binding subunit [Pseudomonadota bacterium]
MTQLTMAARFGSGREVKRIEDEGLLKGLGRFADDFAPPGGAHLRFLRSPHAHACIRALDVRRAAGAPGVLTVYTGAELAAAGVKALPLAPMFKRPDGSPGASPPRPALAVDFVRFVGEAVAAVVATSADEARDALELIEVDYEPLPAVVGVEAACAEGAPLVWPQAGGNIAARMRHGDAAATEAAFAAAAHVVGLDLVNQRLAAAPMEPRACVAEPADGRLTMRLTTQMPSGARDALAGALGVAPKTIRVVAEDVGGGFGMKTGLYPEDIAAAYAARALGRPVRWTAERAEDFLAANHGRDVVTRAEFALDARGKVLAYRIRSQADVGAYASTTGILIQVLIGPWVSTSIYDIRTIDFQFDAVLTHTTPTGAYRGAGRPEAIYITERLFDAAARQTGIDPVEIRRRNLVAASQMPYANAMGQVYDSGDFAAVLDAGLKVADWSGFAQREAASKARGKLRGRGFASFLEWTGGNAFEERVTCAVSGDGGIEVFATTMPMGQGIATSYAQLVVDVFGVDIAKVKIVTGDTDRGVGFGSAGSRSLFTAGSAIDVAAKEAVARGRELAGEALEAAAADIEYAEGEFRVAGTDRAIGLFELAAKQPERRIFVDSTTKIGGPSWPNGCHVCEVEIDPETGMVEVVAYASANDVGRVVNPMIVRGQLDGGAVQGLGQALGEAIVFDATGQAMTASFMDYAMPRAEIVADFKHELGPSTPCQNNPLGAKGVGELGTIGATPAAALAVIDALARAGRAAAAMRMQMPFTAAKVWRALNG